MLLDLGNVLWDDDGVDASTFRVMREMFRAHGLETSKEEVDAAVAAAVEAWAPSVNESVLEHFGGKAQMTPAQARAEWKLVFSDIDREQIRRQVLFPDVRPSLERLHGAGMKLAVATNYGPLIRDRLNELGVGRLIDFWGIASEIGVRKPEPAFFARLLEGLGAAADETVMVGDRLDNDIVPAKRFGIKTVRLLHGLHKGQRERTPQDRPDYVASCFGDATDWILSRSR